VEVPSSAVLVGVWSALMPNLGVPGVPAILEYS
jgi:hypothetical protein